MSGQFRRAGASPVAMRFVDQAAAQKSLMEKLLAEAADDKAALAELQQEESDRKTGMATAAAGV